MRVVITVPIISPGSGLSRYVFSLCNIFKDGNEVLLIETHTSALSPYTTDELAKIDRNIRYISTGGKGKIYNYISNIKQIREFRPDVVISNFNGLTQFILPFINRKTKILHILHNDAPEFYQIASINARFVDAWIAPTEGIRRHFNDYSKNRYADRVKVIHHGVDAPGFKGHKSTGPLKIAFVGIVDQHKGILVVPAIVKRLIEKGVSLHLSIIGGGGKMEWVRDQLKQEIDEGMVTLTGVINHEKVYEYLAEADVFLYPTHLDAFGLVIAEAMINGAVPVVTHLAGITDNLVEDGKSGFLVKQDDVESFVKSIQVLAADRSMLGKFSEAAATRAKELFSMDVMERNYKSLISKLG